MHDRNPVRSVLALVLPAAILLATGCILTGTTARDAVFALMKLVVIR
ncbi:MAG: hypothetical protein ACI4MG_12025 [Aristaeellaceae bacterium]